MRTPTIVICLLVCPMLAASPQSTGHTRSDQIAAAFTKHTSIAGSLLTATKVYRDGDADRFEGVFINRTERATRTDPGVTEFGLGVLLATPIDVDGMTLDKLFYRLLSPE